MTLEFKELSVQGHEKVLEIKDKNCGLHALIAIHDSTMGPALGGTRFYPYNDVQEALTDVLRLSKGMTYKAAIAGLGLGGGKSVVFFDPKKPKPEALLKAFAEAVNYLKGDYICAADYGCSTEDIINLRKHTKYIVGVSHEKSSGDPAPYTAWGTVRGIHATLKKIFDDESLRNRVVAIQGIGNVGMLIAEHLFWQGAKLVISDINQDRLKQAKLKFNAEIVPEKELLKVPCDIFVPCAVGGILNASTIPLLNCRGIAGSANNQLLHDTDALLLKERGIVYAPDFVINAGGLMNVSFELKSGGYNPMLAREKLEAIYTTLNTIYKIADQNYSSTQSAAISLADYRLKYAIGKRENEVFFPEFALV